MQRVPFEKYHLEEPNPTEEGKVISVRLNAEQYARMQKLQKLLDVESESTVLKLCFDAGENVILNSFPERFWRWFSGERHSRIEK